LAISALEYTSQTKTLKIFYATPGKQRGFCSACGSFLFWKDESEATVDLSIGSMDPEFLFGKEGQGGEGTYGIALAAGRGQNFWCVNEILGVTDRMMSGIRVERSSAHTMANTE
jgi:hypothetical protein